MNRLINHPLSGIIASALLLTGILAYLVADRVHLVRTGREIVLPIKPVDPRDLFKGDYARLGYDISRPPQAMMTPIAERVRRGGRVYVTLESSDGGAWHVADVSTEWPRNVLPNQLVIAGRLSHSWQSAITYGIERYFVPEGEGLALEELARKSPVSAIIAVDRSGRAAIKGLMHDGQRVYEEPLF